MDQNPGAEGKNVSAFTVAKTNSEAWRRRVRMTKFWGRKTTILALESSRGRNASAFTWTLHEARRTMGTEIGINLT